MNKNQKIKLIVGVVVLFGALGGMLLISSVTSNPKIPITQTENAETTKPIETTEISKEVSTINKDTVQNAATLEINGSPFTTSIEKNTSVYDFMSKLQNEGKITFTDKTYIGLGKFIDTINGVRGDGTRFWIYYVNGQKSKIGVSNYKINPGDVVSWKYEKDIN